MAWERCDIGRDGSAAFARMQVSNGRIVFSAPALEAIGHVKYLVAYIDRDTKRIAFEKLHQAEIGCSRVTAKKGSTMAGINNQNLVSALVSAGVKNGQKFSMLSNDERQVIFKW